MDYKKQLQTEYSEWNNKKVKKYQRAIQVKGYTEEQIYNQIENITNIAIKEVEEYLVDYMNKEPLSEEESADEESSEGANEASEASEESELEHSEVEDEDALSVCSDNDEAESNPSEDADGELSDVQSVDLDKLDEVESNGHDYSSGELNDIYGYLENECEESGDLLDEPALDTLRKLGK
ncbi:hypothetical protein NEIRO03_0266 [Nematocida sp. AWRm78]|nr:hypothetical protein NEIRO02_0267 [Nematocida sp. AWRm79]KAI5182602.1 hypothetical protein NEIRO03_0266 [Nematocida sp. AWRm78]